MLSFIEKNSHGNSRMAQSFFCESAPIFSASLKMKNFWGKLRRYYSWTGHLPIRFGVLLIIVYLASPLRLVKDSLKYFLQHCFLTYLGVWSAVTLIVKMQQASALENLEISLDRPSLKLGNLTC